MNCCGPLCVELATADPLAATVDVPLKRGIGPDGPSAAAGCGEPVAVARVVADADALAPAATVPPAEKV